MGGLSKADLAQAHRMPQLHDFFSQRTVAELLEDLSWLGQYLVFRHHQVQRHATLVAQARKDIAAGAGHECSEWWLDGQCELCNRLKL